MEEAVNIRFLGLQTDNP